MPETSRYARGGFRIAELKGMHPIKQSGITKGVGLTPTERYLARLAERSFLNLWSYPNPYRDQGQRGVGDGKELCDLLVVCGRDIIIFSEKNIGWPSSPDVKTAWRRWAKRALLDATRQARGRRAMDHAVPGPDIPR